ncbi:hypothetical protein [Corynebacterium resistens]|uniref:hypothetical protein n=1 Tax=Corynebacterium resistens TaxID=258224 RepID=UPI00130546AF|nr:hypothetical protein [Corynebacterium resistens]
MKPSYAFPYRGQPWGLRDDRPASRPFEFLIKDPSPMKIRKTLAVGIAAAAITTGATAPA